ncbi:MAG: hypothetical protein K6C10_06210 [Prevotella sp.]|nr:hypothetical protein [Prevotella sp.]
MKQTRSKKRQWIVTANVVTLLLGFLVTIACSSIDCPLNNRVYAVYKLMGDETPLTDSLTISTIKFDQSDTVLLNRAVNVDSFMLPISYQRPEDVLYFRRSNANGWSATDTVRVRKKDIPHFEAIDCNPSYFHIIEQIEHTRQAIDSIVIIKNKVTYDSTEPHLYIYFKSLSD